MGGGAGAVAKRFDNALLDSGRYFANSTKDDFARLSTRTLASNRGDDVVRVFNFTDEGVDLNRAAGARTSGGVGGTHTTFDNLSDPNVLPIFQDGVVPPPIRSGVVTEIEVPSSLLLPDPTTGNFGHGTQWIAPYTPGAKIVNEWDAVLDEVNWVFEIVPRE